MQLRFEFRPSAVVCAGARATEARLLEEVGRLVVAARHDPMLLATPVRIVVPSRSLRRHLAAKLTRALGPHLLGVTIQTLHQLAQETLGPRDVTEEAAILERVVALRQARREPSLLPLLDGFVDAQDALIDSIRELLAAGFRPSHAEAAVDAIEDATTLAPGEAARASGIVRAAARTAPLAEQLGFDTDIRVFEAAAARIAAGKGPVSRAVLIFGFSDATGILADLLERLLALPGARIFVDLPPDPAEPAALDASARFSERLRDRLRATGAPEAWTQATELDVFVADGADSEVLEVARRVADLLRAGATPESIGVVARDLEGRAPPIRRYFEQLGVPYSGLDLVGPDTPLSRWRALPELMRRGPNVATDKWLDLVGGLEHPDTGEETGLGERIIRLTPPIRSALRLALRSAGAARLAQARQLDADVLLAGKDSLNLPGGSGIDDVRARATPRTLPADVLRAALGAIQRFCAWWEALPPEAQLPEWGAQLDHLLDHLLVQPAEHPVRVPLATLSALPLTVDPEELQVVLTARLADIGRGAFGGNGGGVAVLGVREARGRTFDHLFLLGNNRRSNNPRDAVLTEPVRRALREILPDLPLRSERFDQERYEFAWLLSAAKHTTLSWLTTDSRGKPVSVSPLVERLRWNKRWETASQARPAFPQHGSVGASVFERAVAAGVWGRVDGLAEVLPVLLRMRGVPDAERVGSGQIGVLREKDGGPSAGNGPWFGEIGADAPETAPDRQEPDPFSAFEEEDPWAPPVRTPKNERFGTLYVSRAEELVGCPWQTLLQRHLAVEPVPDPLARVPQADDRLAGILVHRVLEAVLRGSVPARGGTLAQLAEREPQPAPWPSADVVRRITRVEATRILDQEGIRLPGLALLLSIRAEPYVEAARALDWGGAGPLAVGAEVNGQFQFEGRTVAFRADRADVNEGRLTLTDYKTGKSFADVANSEARRSKLAARMREGRALQIAAYARAESGGVDVGGRLAFLAPDTEHRVLWAHEDDVTLQEHLNHALRSVFKLLDAGVFFPRLVEPDVDREPRRCGSCVVAEACVRGDSGDRARLRRYAQGLRERGADTEQQRAFLVMWGLPAGG